METQNCSPVYNTLIYIYILGGLKVAHMNSSKVITILLADDHPLARQGIRSLLMEANDLQIIGEAENGFQVKELVANLKPDILLLDLKMPGPRPAELEKWVRENYPKTVTLVLTSHDRDHYLASMLDAGATGYMDKNITSKRLINAIRRAVNGDLLFDQSQMKRILDWKGNIDDKVKQLTEQEKKVLFLLSKGFDNNKIASILNISKKTASFHLTNIFIKIGVTTRLEAALWAKDNLPDNLE
ncbi:MAG: response regulator transcription factor [Anaerolineales bacterium]